jgi:hypothetical protein
MCSMRKRPQLGPPDLAGSEGPDVPPKPTSFSTAASSHSRRLGNAFRMPPLPTPAMKRKKATTGSPRQPLTATWAPKRSRTTSALSAPAATVRRSGCRMARRSSHDPWSLPLARTSPAGGSATREPNAAETIEIQLSICDELRPGLAVELQRCGKRCR